MEKYYYDSELGVLFIRHFGYFVGADATETVMRIARTSSMQIRQSIKGILFDFRDVEHATLANSDRAYSEQSIARMNRAFPQFWEIRVARLLGQNTSVRQVFEERERRMRANAGIEGEHHRSFDKEAEAFEHLGIPADYRIPYPK